MLRRLTTVPLLALLLGPWILGRASTAVASGSPTPSRTSSTIRQGLATVSPGADFNGDGYGDVAVAVYDETLEEPTKTIGDAGAINTIYGSSGGFTSTGNQFWNQDSPGIKGTAATGNNFGRMPCDGDFNGDGFVDMATGIARQAVTFNGQRLAEAGAVTVIYGSAAGLAASAGPGNQLFNQASPGIPGDPQAGANMGWPCEAGDFNNDGYADLAISEQTASVNGQTAAGTVNVIYGGPNGLNASAGPGAQLWDQDSSGIVDQAETGDQFGRSLAAGDFNNDGYQDLAIGVPHEDLEEGPTTIVDAGGLQVIYGGPNGLQADAGPGNQFFTEDSLGMAGTGAHTSDWFARTGLRTGDFNGDGYMDIGIGIWLEDIDGLTDAGATEVMYGGPGGLSTTGSQWFNGDSPGMPGGGAQIGATMGRYVTTGDYNADGYADYAIGIQLQDVIYNGSRVKNAGAAIVLYGGSNGLDVSNGPGAQYWQQGAGGVPGVPVTNAQMGRSEGSGDFNGDGYADLIIGVPSATVGTVGIAGAFVVIYGGPVGLDTSNAPGAQIWDQDSPGILDNAEQGDYFGRWFAAG